VPEPIPVEVVDIGEITNTRIDEPKPEPPKPPPPKPTPTVPQNDPPPPPPEPQAEPEPPPPVEAPVPPPVAEPEPAPVPPEPKPEPPKPELKKMAELPKPEEPKTKELEAPKPLPKKDPPKEEPKKPERSLDSVLKNVLKQKEEAPQQETKEAQDRPQPSSDAPSRSDRLSVSEEDALRRQISQCWNVDPGAKGVAEMSAEFRVFFDTGLNVTDVRFLSGSGSMSDPRFRSFVESAHRALRMPKCSKLQLPLDKYADAGTIVINFSPRDMF